MLKVPVIRRVVRRKQPLPVGRGQLEFLELRAALPHQEQALAYAKKRNRIALFMEMRLGKSLVAVRWAQDKIKNSGFEPECIYGKTHRVLIVAPLTVLPEWEKELRKEGIYQSDIHWLTGKKEERLSASNPFMLDRGWFLVNYHGLRACPELLKHDWFTVIVDESTAIRNPQAQITKLCIEGFSYVKNRCILSGLPNPESPMDYFSQFNFLFGGFMGLSNFWYWRGRNFHKGFTDWDWLPNPGAIEAIKKEVHSLAFIKTRKQCKIGSKKIYEVRHVAMTPKQKKVYKQLEKEFAYEYEPEYGETKYSTVKFMWMAQVASGFLPEKKGKISDEKLKELLYLLRGELKDEKVVVWFRFNEELRSARELLNREGISTAEIYGDIPIEQRKERTDQFREQRDPRIMLAQVKCGKFGLDWSVASTAIYFSNPYDMEDRAQSEDRIVHPTKDEPLLYIDLVTKDTVDEDVIEVLKEKKVNAHIFKTMLLEHWKARFSEK